MLKIEMRGTKEAIAELRGLSAKVKAALQKALKRAAVLVESEAKRIIYRGRPDHLIGRSGRLRQSITHEVMDTSAAVGTNVVYARIHEEGGTTSPHVIRPVNAQALAFQVGGNTVFAAFVNHPGSQIPARPYLKPALDSQEDTIRDLMEDAVEKVLP